ncbi:Glycosyltransferase involved in cell wall bisynthesis [Thiothrix caldifontis]|uniref:Glycosyltransferase involved in cell wall bisynthesis n=1 Tax=Thiothrix caldifontis TaxID=525918 RepID=A0A1H4DLU5_9GAMM|nr:glycosyltransferase family 4 protein [Thiothrix caldifontis]SEA73725.1 Glycosyltransferase involved in cell wall bisynthesis [Thiothrix caldifontis]
MRLLIVAQYFWPENFRINDLVTELIHRGHEITVLTGKPNYPDGIIFKEFLDNQEKFSTYHGAEVIRVPLFPRGKGGWRLILNYFSFALNATLIGSWKLRKKNFDAIFSFEPSPITVALPAIALRKQKKIPFTFWILDLWPETLEAIGVVRSKILLKWIGKLVTFIYNRTDLILAQSQSFITQIRQYAGTKSHIEYYPSWSETLPDLEDAPAAPEVIADNNKFNIVFAGNIGEAQDFPAILAAAEHLKHHDSIRWLIVGDGRQAEWVTSEIIKRGLENKVVMLGRHPLERMPSFFKHADALLVSLKDTPIFSMTIPGKVQTYLATGIPIIAMLNGEGANIIEKAQSGLTCPAGNSQQLAEIVLKLSLMPLDERQRMGNNGKILNETTFNRERLISQLEEWLTNTTLNEKNA